MQTPDTLRFVIFLFGCGLTTIGIVALVAEIVLSFRLRAAKRAKASDEHIDVLARGKMNCFVLTLAGICFGPALGILGYYTMYP